MRILLTVAFLAGDTSCSGPPSIAGTWIGRLDETNVAVVGLELPGEGRSARAGSLTLLDRGSVMVPAALDLTADSVIVSSRSHGISFAGTPTSDRTRLQGTYTRDGRSATVTLSRLPRPQEPVGPFPYDTTRVSFQSAPGVTLAGTLAIPFGAGPFPVVVLVSGSGAQDRDGSMFLHHPFWVLADYFARHGVASLRYDDRGTAQSTGSFDQSTIADFAMDAEAAVRFVARQPRIASERVGLVGHSQGGLIAPMVAGRSSLVAFVVLLAAPALMFDSVAILQSRSTMIAQGASASAIDSAARRSRATYKATLSSSESPTYRYWTRYDPAAALQRLRVPTLALNGTKDLQVSAEEHLRAIHASLVIAKNPDFAVRALQGLNHLFQHATTGLMNEYALIDETIAPEAMAAMTEWIRNRFDRH